MVGFRIGQSRYFSFTCSVTKILQIYQRYNSLDNLSDKLARFAINSNKRCA